MTSWSPDSGSAPIARQREHPAPWPVTRLYARDALATTVAAGAVLAALGGPGDPRASLFLVALRAGWLTREEATSLLPLASSFAEFADLELPPHRGRP